MNRPVVLVAGVVIVAVGLVALLLSTGGSSVNARSGDEAGDVTVGRGSKPPRDLGWADIREVRIGNGDGSLTFQARMGAPLDRRLREGSGEWKWEIFEGGNLTWIVSANVNVGLSASMIATQTEYSATTIDKSLPGKVSIAGDTILVRLNIAEIEGFPESFETVLKTTLDASRSETSSALAEDRAPKNDSLTVGE